MKFKYTITTIALCSILVLYNNCGSFESIETKSQASNGDTGQLVDSPSGPVDTTPDKDDDTTTPRVSFTHDGQQDLAASFDFQWIDLDKQDTTIYDLWIGSQPGERDIYDHIGEGKFNESSLSVENLPQNGKQVFITLLVFRDGPTSAPVEVTQVMNTKNIDIIVDGPTDPDTTPDSPDNDISSAGKLWGVTHGTTNNTNQHLSFDPNNSKAQVRHAIPFRSIHSTITSLQINLRADNQPGRIGHYTKGNGGTVRVLLVADNNCKPDMRTVLFTGKETVGDMSQWKDKNAFLAEYPGATWNNDSKTHTTSINGQKHNGNTSVTIGDRYWLVVEQVRGGQSNYPSINYFRSGNSDDYARNWLNRTQDPTQDCLVPMSQKNDTSTWKSLERHPVYTVEGNNGIQGNPYYNQGTAPDDEPGTDRYSNINSGDSVRNIWKVPGTKTINKVHLCMMRQTGSGEVQLRVNGNLVATWKASDFPTKKTEAYPATFEAARWRSKDIKPITLTGEAIFEVTVVGTADMEMGSIKEGRIFMPLSTGTNGTPDISSQYRLNKGSWKTPDSGRIKYSIAYNEEM